jgi:lipopolysaccharide transport system ATP-binding protein
VRQYNELNFRRVRQEASEQGGPEALRRAPVAELLDAAFEGPDGDSVFSGAQGEPLCVRLDVRFHAPVEEPSFAIALRNDRGQTAFATSTQLREESTGSFAAGELATVRVRFENWLSPGRYRLTASVTREGIGADAYDLREDISSLVVYAARSGGGAVDLPHRFEIERG